MWQWVVVAEVLAQVVELAVYLDQVLIVLFRVWHIQ
jgi:hypothetical protein